MIRHLFVYGTLLSSVGAPAHARVAGRATLVGPATIPGRLHDAGEYPAATGPDGEGDRIVGEVYEVGEREADALLAELDDYEGFVPDAPHRSLFRREAGDATLWDGRVLRVWTYRYGRPVEGLPRIAGGDYRAHLRRRGPTLTAHLPQRPP